MKMADPLSPATRATKRNLLLASVLAISANAFNVSIDKIPVGGLSITFDDRLFAFLLVITLTYFLCTFTLYYAIDIKNLDTTKHQTDAAALYRSNLQSFDSIYAARMGKRLKRHLPKGYSVSTVGNTGSPLSVDDMTKGAFDITGTITVDSIQKFDRKTARHDAALYESLDPHVQRLAVRYPTAWKQFFLKQWALNSGRNAMYFSRNYFFDGILPIGLGAFSLVATLGHFDLHWIQQFLPRFNVLN